MSTMAVELVAIDSGNWRDVAELSVAAHQREWVAPPTYYLALCTYGEAGWRPLAVRVDGVVAGFLMWTVDPEDGAAWIGGVVIDQAKQGRGVGRAAVGALTALIASEEPAVTGFALSYEPANQAARQCYAGLGFVETGETEDTEVVARLSREG
ncbi:GNAT family N-acetyltransferase [Catenuloplanes japonicus]|uniref:GNAT family N-acetyltransferase n=1 Tax=Catenuloplanes japonicus TaxID=33876 RepID=UPI00068B53E5|nr:GNAT family N-acetyltransferase [Catenuloplanes japonicus]